MIRQEGKISGWWVGVGIVLVLAVILLVTFSSSRSGDLGPAPALALEDIHGNTVTSDDFKGKAYIANSWATWCPFCVDELPDFALLQEEFGDEIAVIAIDRAESLEKSKEFTDDLDLTDKLIYLIDPSDSFYASIGGFSMPETIFVDSEGTIKIHKRGPMPLEEMRSKTLELLGR